MTEIMTTVYDLDAWPWQVLLSGLIGVVAGSLHFQLLNWNTQRFLSGNIGIALFSQILRFAVLGLILMKLAQWGPVQLLAGTAGLLLARQWVLRSVRTMQ